MHILSYSVYLHIQSRYQKKIGLNKKKHCLTVQIMIQCVQIVYCTKYKLRNNMYTAQDYFNYTNIQYAIYATIVPFIYMHMIRFYSEYVLTLTMDSLYTTTCF